MNLQLRMGLPEDYVHERAEYFRQELTEANRQLAKWTSKKSRDETGNPHHYTRGKLEKLRNDCRARVMFLMDAMRALNIKRGDELDAE